MLREIGKALLRGEYCGGAEKKNSSSSSLMKEFAFVNAARRRLLALAMILPGSASFHVVSYVSISRSIGVLIHMPSIITEPVRRELESNFSSLSICCCVSSISSSTLSARFPLSSVRRVTLRVAQHHRQPSTTVASHNSMLKRSIQKAAFIFCVSNSSLLVSPLTKNTIWPNTAANTSQRRNSTPSQTHHATEVIVKKQ